MQMTATAQRSAMARQDESALSSIFVAYAVTATIWLLFSTAVGVLMAYKFGAPDFGPGAGDAPGFGPGAGCGALATAPAGDGLVATPAGAAWPLGLGAFDFSLAIANSSLSDPKENRY